MSKSSKLSRVGFVLIPMGLLLMALGVGLSLVLTNQFGEAIEDAQESSLPGVEQAVGTGKTMTVWASTGYLSCEVTDAQDQQAEVSTTSSSCRPRQMSQPGFQWPTSNLMPMMRMTCLATMAETTSKAERSLCSTFPFCKFGSPPLSCTQGWEVVLA
jgi:hypothetical protein